MVIHEGRSHLTVVAGHTVHLSWSCRPSTLETPHLQHFYFQRDLEYFTMPELSRIFQPLADKPQKTYTKRVVLSCCWIAASS